MRHMLFVRTYHGMLGGHLKVFDYMHHVRASGLFEPVLYLTPESTQSPREWLPEDTEIVDRAIAADAYFIGGFNWRILDAAGIDLRGKPVVNLLQGLRHAEPGDPRQAYLPRPALRVCVSAAVYESVKETRLCNGPLVVIRNGIDVERLSRIPPAAKERRVFVAGIKNAPFARELGDELRRRGIACDVCDEMLERDAFLARMGSCEIAVTLPDPQEGFFLPPLEAMAMGCAVILPECRSASSYAFDRRTCLTPALEIRAIAEAVEELRTDDALASRLREKGGAIAREHSLARERREFTDALRAFAGASGVC